MNQVLKHLVAVGVAGISLHAVAQTAGSVAQASFSITSMAYTLTDLNPSDGVTPWVSFGSAAQGKLRARDAENFTVVEDLNQASSVPTFFSSSSGHVGLSNGSAQASVSNTGLAVSGNVASSQITNAIARAQSDAGLFSYSDNSSSSNVDALTFTLSPGSAITFTGVLQGSLSLDAASVTNLLTQSGFPADYTLTIAGGANIYASMPGQAEGANIENQLWLVMDYSQATSSFAGPYADLQTFSVTLRNESNVSAQGSLSMSAWQGSLLRVSGVPAIPEPSTWAFFALGLVAVATASVRQRRSKAQA